MSKPHYWANRDRWQLEMSWNDLANSGCLWTWGCSQIPRSLAGALPAARFPRPLSSWGEQLGCRVQLGPEVGEEWEGESIKIHLFPAGRCISSLLPFLAALCCFFLPRRPRHCQVSSPVGDGCDKIPGWLYLFLRSGLVGHSWRDSVPGTHIRDNAWDNALKGMQIPYQCTHPQVLGLLPPFVMAIHFTLFFSRLTKHFCLMFPVAQDNIMKCLEILFMPKLYRKSGNFRCFSYCLFSMGLLEHNLKQYTK